MFAVLVPNPAVPPAPGTVEAADLVLDSIVELDGAIARLEAEWTGDEARPVKP